MALSIGTLTGVIALEDQFSNALNTVVGKAEASMGRLSGVFKPAAVAAAAVTTALTAAAGAIVTLGVRGADIDNVSNTLDSFAGSTENATEILEEMQRATLGTVTRFDLMKESAHLLAAGVDLNAQDFGKLAEAAKLLNNQGLGPTEDMLKMVSDAMVTGRTRSLEMAIGVIDTQKAENQLALSLGKTREKLSESEKVLAARTSILDALEKKTAAGGKVVRDFGDMVAMVRTKIVDWFDRLSVGIATSDRIRVAFDKMLGALRSLGFDGDTAMKTIISAVESFVEIVSTGFGHVVSITKQMVDAFNALSAQSLPSMGTSLKVSTYALGALSILVGSTAKGLDLLTSSLVFAGKAAETVTTPALINTSRALVGLTAATTFTSKQVVEGMSSVGKAAIDTSTKSATTFTNIVAGMSSVSLAAPAVASAVGKVTLSSQVATGAMTALSLATSPLGIALLAIAAILAGMHWDVVINGLNKTADAMQAAWDIAVKYSNVIGAVVFALIAYNAEVLIAIARTWLLHGSQLAVAIGINATAVALWAVNTALSFMQALPIVGLLTVIALAFIETAKDIRDLFKAWNESKSMWDFLMSPPGDSWEQKFIKWITGWNDVEEAANKAAAAMKKATGDLPPTTLESFGGTPGAAERVTRTPAMIASDEIAANAAEYENALNAIAITSERTRKELAALTAEQRRRITVGHEGHQTDEQIAKGLNLTSDTVAKVVKAYEDAKDKTKKNLEEQQEAWRDYRSFHADVHKSLSNDIIEAINWEIRQGTTQDLIAKTYRVTAQQVDQLVTEYEKGIEASKAWLEMQVKMKEAQEDSNQFFAAAGPMLGETMAMQRAALGGSSQLINESDKAWRNWLQNREGMRRWAEAAEGIRSRIGLIIPEMKSLGEGAHLLSSDLKTTATEIRENLGKTLEGIPDLLIKAFTGGGDMIGAMKALAVDIGDAIITPLLENLTKMGKAAVGIGNAFGAAFGKMKGLEGLPLLIATVTASTIGAAVATTAWGKAMIAAGIDGAIAMGLITAGISLAIMGLTLLIMKFVGVSKAVQEARDKQEAFRQKLHETSEEVKANGDEMEDWEKDLISIRDLFAKTGRSAEDALKVTEALWDTENPRRAAAAQREVNKAIKESEQAYKDAQQAQEDLRQDTEDLKEAMEKYNFTIGEMGPAFRKQEMAKQAMELVNDWRLLVGAGANVGLVADRMGKSFSDFVQTAIATGTEVPKAMQPVLQSMIDNGELLDENGEAYKNLADTGLTFSETMTEGFDRVVKKLEELINTMMGIPTDVTVQGHVDWTGIEPPGGATAGAGNQGPNGAHGMARGGYGTVMKPTYFLAGEAGAEDFAFRPVSERNAASGGKGGQLVVPVQIQGREIARAVVPLIPSELRRMGVI